MVCEPATVDVSYRNQYNLIGLSEIKEMICPVKLSPLGTRLLGRPLGQKHFGQLCELLGSMRAGSTVLLDFAGVENVNASWINAAISPLFPWSARNENDVFPLVCNFPAQNRDELELVCTLNDQCIPLGAATNELRLIELIGPLDPALEETLHLVVQRGQATGADLGRDVDAGIGPTGWNNRLRDLYVRRLVYRTNAGRRQLYSAIAKEVVRNG
jgi:hypothetical protein